MPVLNRSVANDAVDGAHSAASECQRVVAFAVYRKLLGIVPINQLAPDDAAGFDDSEERVVWNRSSFQELKLT